MKLSALIANFQFVFVSKYVLFIYNIFADIYMHLMGPPIFFLITSTPCKSKSTFGSRYSPKTTLKTYDVRFQRRIRSHHDFDLCIIQYILYDIVSYLKKKN